MSRIFLIREREAKLVKEAFKKKAERSVEFFLPSYDFQFVYF